MGKKNKMEMLNFGVEYAKKCAELENRYDVELDVGCALLRFGNHIVSLQALAESASAKDAENFINDAECDIEQFLDNKYYDGVITTDGYLYEALYAYQGMGDTFTYGKNATENIYSELVDVLEKHDFRLDLSRGGSILLQSEESFNKELAECGIMGYRHTDCESD